MTEYGVLRPGPRAGRADEQRDMRGLLVHFHLLIHGALAELVAVVDGEDGHGFSVQSRFLQAGEEASKGGIGQVDQTQVG